MSSNYLLGYVTALVAAFALFWLFIGGGTIVASYLAWRWALRLVVAGRALRPARVLNVIVLVASALPAGLTFVPTFALPSPRQLVTFAVLGGCSLAATVHAAYRDDCIRRLGEEPELMQKLASVAHEADRYERIRQLLKASNVVDFSGPTRRRALVRALRVTGVIVLVLTLARA